MLEVNSTDLLIAPPGIPDPRFRDTVVVLTHNHDGGSFGLVINRPTRYTTQDILEEINPEISINFPIYWGGPVNSGTIWMLHSAEWTSEHTVEINEQWSMTSNLSMFHRLNEGDVPDHFRLMAGFASWAPDQLESEIIGEPPWNQRHSWLLAKNPGPEWLFEQPVDLLWQNATTLSSHQAVDSWL